jgi:pimeloyl-ACP methyl ester carboxylesterase
MEISWIDSDDGLGHKTKEFAFEKNRKVTGALWLPQETSKTLICLGHGASGDRYQAPLSYLAGRFVAAGYPCLSIDGPVHGLRSVGDGGRGAFFPDFQREESVIEMVEDWNDSVMVATELIGDCKLAYFGLSMGSIFGIPFVASRSDVVVSCPVLYLMQMEDELFNRDGYLRVFDALATKDKRLHANPGLHPEVPDEEVLFAFQFMRDVIEGHYDPGKALGLDA